MEIMSWDAVGKQSKITSGVLPSNKTVDLEADESSFAHWTDGDDHYWYPFVGVVQRGAPETLYMEAMGITHSIGEARVPPMTKERWGGTCERVFTADTRANLFSDGAKAYASVKHPGIIEHVSVNHTEKGVRQIM